MIRLQVLHLYVDIITGSRSKFEFPSRVNLSGPSLNCTKLYGQD